MRNLKRAYLDWLYKQIDNRERRNYFNLCEILYDRQFVWSVPNDDNRAQDGRELREYFISEKIFTAPEKLYDAFLEEDCTVLEALIGIAKRMDFILYDMSRSEETPKWFMILLKNLGLDKFTNNRCNSNGEFSRQDMDEIDGILQVWLDRKYDHLGRNGSLFPIKGNCPRDMRRTEIWYQMHAWIQENYPDF